MVEPKSQKCHGIPKGIIVTCITFVYNSNSCNISISYHKKLNWIHISLHSSKSSKSKNTSLNLIITSIDHAHHQLKIIIEYRSKMRELHSLVSLNDKLKIWISPNKKSWAYLLNQDSTNPMILGKDVFAMVGAHLIHGKRTKWVNRLCFFKPICYNTKVPLYYLCK